MWTVIWLIVSMIIGFFVGNHFFVFKPVDPILSGALGVLAGFVVGLIVRFLPKCIGEILECIGDIT